MPTNSKRRRPAESVNTDSPIPTLSQMVRAGQQSAGLIKRGTETALLEWLKQSERLNIVRSHYGLRGARFEDFAGRIGVDRSSAFQLVKLWPHRKPILKRCQDDGRFYGWETCLYWHEPAPRKWNRTYFNRGEDRSDERHSPKEIFQQYGSKCTLDVAATPENALCKNYFTKRQNGLKQTWRGVVWMNPPYSDLLPWCCKAVEYARAGGTVIALLPAWTDALFFHEFCSLGHITFIRNRLVFPGESGAHSPFASIIVEWTPETVSRGGGTELDSVLGSKSSGSQKPIQRGGRYWLTPPDLYRALDAEFHFDHDPCPYPLPEGHNGLTTSWGQTNFVNPPFRKDDVVGGSGPTAFVRKAITEQGKGKTSVLVLPIFDYVSQLLEAGAEIRPLGRVRFRDVDSDRSANHPLNIACFVLRGN